MPFAMRFRAHCLSTSMSLGRVAVVGVTVGDGDAVGAGRETSCNRNLLSRNMHRANYEIVSGSSKKQESNQMHNVWGLRCASPYHCHDAFVVTPELHAFLLLF